jgi:putative membrane protein
MTCARFSKTERRNMTKFNGYTIRISRGLAASAVLLTALAIRADQNGFDTRKDASGAPATAETAKQNDPATCIKEAAKMNQATIQFAQLAQQKAQNAELKRFGQTLEQDHVRAQSKLQTIAKNYNVTLPTGASALDEKCQAELTKLQGLSGSEFDKEFAKGAVEGHAMAAAHLEKASTQAQDADLRQYTRDMLTQVRSHQREARQIAAAVGVDQATITSLETKKPEGVGAPGSETQSSTESSSKKETSDKKF